MKISLLTLGCKLNQAETEELKRDILTIGFSIAPFDSREDVAVIRACGVTSGAGQTTREMIRRVKRHGAYIIAAGCLENKELAEIDFIGDTNDSIIKHLAGLARFSPSDHGNETNQLGQPGKTRAFIKIQTGCNFQCAYCVIPSFRGKSRSVPAEQVIKKIKLIQVY